MKFLLWILIAYVVYRMLRGKRELPVPEAKPAEEAHRDPVCGVYVSSGDAVVGRLDGEKIYFCSHGCLEKFRDTLEKTETRKEREP